MIFTLSIAAILLSGFMAGWLSHIALIAHRYRKVSRRLEQFKRDVHAANQSLMEAQRVAQALSNQWRATNREGMN